MTVGVRFEAIAIDGARALEEIAPAWRELLHASSSETLFLTPEWMSAWWSASGHEGVIGSLAIPFAIVCGFGIGILNGIGVAYLRVPSMIFTLATNAIAQGLMVVHTSGFAPQEHATPAMHFIAVERSILGIPNAVWVW